MADRKHMALILAIGGLLTLISLAHTVHTYATCDGTVVRGLLILECLEEARRG